MQKYQGELIYQGRDALGPIEVVDDGFYRSLHFGSDAKQSCMLLRDPNQLALSYTRAMCAALLFCEAPQRILLLGLGGGSLAKFLLHHYPDCHIDAVEFRPQVHQVAQEFFSLPETARLQLHFEDAGIFLRGADSDKSGYDLILIDAFLEHGIAYSVSEMHFFDACRERLSATGVMAINLWADDRIHAHEFIEDISASFNAEVLQLPVEGRANLVAIATRLPAVKRQLKRLDVRARALEQQTSVEFGSLLKALRRSNRRFF